MFYSKRINLKTIAAFFKFLTKRPFQIKYIHLVLICKGFITMLFSTISMKPKLKMAAMNNSKQSKMKMKMKMKMTKKI